MYQHCKLYIIAYLLGIIPLTAIAAVQDSIPPVFTTLPANFTVSCEIDPVPDFTDWFTSTAGAIADNGDASVFTTISLDAALDSLALKQELSCSNDGILSISFFAIDSCGLQSEVEQADFVIIDNTAPVITNEASDLSAPCDSMTIAVLQDWLDMRGGAIATDNCNDSISGVIVE